MYMLHAYNVLQGEKFYLEQEIKELKKLSTSLTDRGESNEALETVILDMTHSLGEVVTALEFIRDEIDI